MSRAERSSFLVCAAAHFARLLPVYGVVLALERSASRLVNQLNGSLTRYDMS